MSDQTINQPAASLKYLNAPLEKLGRMIDRLDILAYRYLRVSACCKELSIRYKELSEVLDQFDSLAFEIRQEYTLLIERCRTENPPSKEN